MNFRLVSYLLSKLSLACAASLLAPIIVAIIMGESFLKPFVATIIVALIIAFLLDRYGKTLDDKITYREGVAMVAIAWVMVTFIGSLPYVFTGVLAPISAYFESMSGFTTTGATAISNIEILPRSILFWRSLTHWMGGIGIVVIFIALLPSIGNGAAHMYNAEVTGHTAERVLPRIKKTSAALVTLYMGITGIEAFLLYFAGMSVFDCITHAFSTIATGGFSSYDTSIVYFHSPLIEAILSFFMIIAGGNFALYYSVGKNGIKELGENTEFKYYIGIIIVAITAITLNLVLKTDYNLLESLRHSSFQVASIISTTGFVSNDFDVWPTFSKLVLMLLMFIGGCAGSTAGGIKVSRLVILGKLAYQEFKKIVHPNMITNVFMNKKAVPISIISGIVRFFFLYIVLFAILALLLTITGISVSDSIGIIAATISSVGPAYGIAGATCTYADLPSFAKIVICVAMLLGRLELFTLMILLRPEFWRSTRNW